MNKYKVQDGCWNCINVYKFFEYDCEVEYYCNKNGNRPYSGSIAQNDLSPTLKKYFNDYSLYPSDEDDEILFKEEKEWCEWSKKYKVCPNGICNEHSKKENENETSNSTEIKS